jgi:cytochrome c-type biogenesis protein CcmH
LNVRARFAFGASIVFLVAALLFFLKNYSAESSASETTTNSDVFEGLTCQCGCGLTVANCNMPTCSFAVPLRHDIDGMIAKGMTRAQIIAFYRKQYGEKILSAPTTEGFNILAWTMPFIALMVGGVAMMVAVGRWHSPAPTEPKPGASPAPFDPELRRRLEKELEERR